MYDPMIGQFVMADTVVPGGGFDPQLLNRYSYVRNKPLNYVDPSGHQLGSPGKADLKEVGSKTQHDWSSGGSERGDDGKDHTWWGMTQQKKPTVFNKLFGWEWSTYTEYEFEHHDTNSGFNYKSNPFESSFGFDPVQDFMLRSSKLAVEKFKFFSSRMARGVGTATWETAYSLYSNQLLYNGLVFGFKASRLVANISIEYVKSDLRNACLSPIVGELAPAKVADVYDLATKVQAGWSTFKESRIVADSLSADIQDLLK